MSGRAPLLLVLCLGVGTARAEMTSECKTTLSDIREKIFKQEDDSEVDAIDLVSVLGEHMKKQDYKTLVSDCNKFRHQMDQWEHAESGPASKPLKPSDIGENYAKFMKGLIQRDRSAWDGHIAALKKQGYTVDLKLAEFKIVLTHDLTGGQTDRGVQRLQTELDLCSPQGASLLGSASTRALVSAKPVKDDQLRAVAVRDYASAHLPEECGVAEPADLGFLRTKGALLSEPQDESSSADK